MNFDDDVWKDGYCVRKNYFGWEVFTRDRGIEFNAIEFPSESNALESLYESLVSFTQKFGSEYLMSKIIILCNSPLTFRDELHTVSQAVSNQCGRRIL